MRKRFLFSFVLIALIFGLIQCKANVKLKSDQDPRADLANRLRDHVKLLSSDSLEGRLPGTEGIEKSARYIIQIMEVTGVDPLFSGNWKQTFEVNLGVIASESSLVNINGKDLELGKEFQVLPVSSSCKMEGNLLFDEDTKVGKGSIVCYLIPEEVESQRWGYAGQDNLLNWMTTVCESASALGALSVVFVSKKEENLHLFAQKPRYRQCPICGIEVRRGSILSALGWDDFPNRTDFTGGYESFQNQFKCKIDVSIKLRSIKTSNIGGLISGKKRKGAYVVIGAHYDHLGYGDIASAMPWRREVHGGADDNASGVSALIEIARILSENPLDCSCAIVFFSAEEIGAVGAEQFLRNPPIPTDSVIAMINLDTVGRLEEEKLIVFGAYSAKEMEDLLKSCAKQSEIEPVLRKETYGASDQNPFYARGIPSMHLFTGAHEDYHSPDDTWEKLNYRGLARIVEFTVRLAELISNTRLTPVLEKEEVVESGKSRGAFLGIVPDFTYIGTGVGVKGCLPQSPAEITGLANGDVILEIDGKPVADLKALSGVLLTKQPGDEIEIKILRDSEVISKRVMLGAKREK
ncbi:MAG: M20/M25/M40 family metallo-hydrolase [bacterium]